MDYDKLAVELMEKMLALHKSKLHRNINEALHGEAFILQYIAMNTGRDGGVLPGDISLEMSVSSARVAAALKNLENKGFVTRRIDKSDRRKIIVEITPQGKDSADKYYSKIVDEVTRFLQLLGEGDAKEYVRIMGRVAQAMPELWENWRLC
ncbi:MAG: transcriptional regulator [Oscillospiraceae bacterium]|nr:transcriptional regulator [Oscillospiraceae bacterium]